MSTVRTVRQLLESSLRKIGAYHPSEAPEAEDIQTALIALQDLISEWGDGGLLVPVYITEFFNLIVGTATYTVGESGTPSKSTVRPEQVIGAYTRDGDTDWPVNIIGKLEYDGLPDKTTSGSPERLFVDYTSPNATFYVYPVPDSVLPFYFTSIKKFTDPSVLTSDLFITYQIPRIYHNALVWNLALEITEEYGKPPTALMVKRAQETKSNVLAVNAARSVMPARLDVPGEFTGFSSYSGMDALVGR